MESDAECAQPFIFSLQSLNHVNLVQHLLTHTCELLLEQMHTKLLTLVSGKHRSQIKALKGDHL